MKEIDYTNSRECREEVERLKGENANLVAMIEDNDKINGALMTENCDLKEELEIAQDANVFLKNECIEFREKLDQATREGRR